MTLPATPHLHSVSPLVKWIDTSRSGRESSFNTFLKLDNLQPDAHSFKIRGLGHSIMKEMERNPSLKLLISSSGGNAGLAAAVVAKRLFLDIIVYVPSSTSDMAQSVLKSHGAKVIVSGKVWDEAHQAAIKCLKEQERGSAFLVHPFEGLDTWQGHSTLVDEIFTQINSLSLENQRQVAQINQPSSCQVDVLVCSVGGGGLLNGILTGLLSIKPTPHTIVVAVETVGAASFAAAVAEDKLVQIPAISSIAKSLGARQVSQGCIDLRIKYGKEKVRSLVVSDSLALQGVKLLANDLKMLVEPACGASLAPVLVDPSLLLSAVPEISPSSNVVVEVCGGFQVNLNMIAEWSEELL